MWTLFAIVGMEKIYLTTQPPAQLVGGVWLPLAAGAIVVLLLPF